MKEMSERQKDQFGAHIKWLIEKWNDRVTQAEMVATIKLLYEMQANRESIRRALKQAKKAA